MKDAFVMAFNRVIMQKNEIISICETTIAERCDTTSIDVKIASLRTELEAITDLMKICIAKNARTTMNQDEFWDQYSGYETQSTAIQESIASLESQKTALIAKRNGIQDYIAILRSQDRITGFSESLWLNCVDRVWINPDGTMRFDFRGGPSIEG